MLIVVRVVVLSLLLIGSLIFGTLPICLRLDASSRRRRAAVSCLSLFGNGVLLATCLVHLLHEVRLGFEEALAKCENETLPLSTVLEKELVNGSVQCGSSSCANGSRPHSSVLEKEPVYDSALCGAEILRTRFPLPEFVTTCGFFLALLVEEFAKWLVRRRRDPLKAAEDVVTVLALSFSSVLEGFAAGFQHTELSTWLLFVSLALHQYVSAFVVGLEALHGRGGRLRAGLCAALLALMCPAGMTAAIVAHNNLVEYSSLRVGLLNAMSVGTLLHVAFYEMLRQRRDAEGLSSISQLLVLLLGFGAMSAVEYFYTRLE